MAKNKQNSEMMLGFNTANSLNVASNPLDIIYERDSGIS